MNMSRGICGCPGVQQASSDPFCPIAVELRAAVMACLAGAEPDAASRVIGQYQVLCPPVRPGDP